MRDLCSDDNDSQADSRMTSIVWIPAKVFLSRSMSIRAQIATPQLQPMLFSHAMQCYATTNPRALLTPRPFTSYFGLSRDTTLFLMCSQHLLPLSTGFANHASLRTSPTHLVTDPIVVPYMRLKWNERISNSPSIHFLHPLLEGFGAIAILLSVSTHRLLFIAAWASDGG